MSAKDEAIKRKMESTIGLSPGKAPGKTPPEPWRAKGIGVLSEMKDKRIAEMEAELARKDDLMNRWIEKCDKEKTRAEKAEAEVERLRHLGGAPPGVSPSPQCPDCERDPPAYAGVHARWHDSERVCPVCSSQMICPTPSRHYGVIPRKERDDG